VALGSKTNGHSRNGGLASSPSVTSQTSQASSISHWSQSDGAGHRPNISPLPSPRAGSSPSPDLQNQNRIVSGISNLSDTDRGHLRGISETSVSTDGVYATPMERGEGMATPQGQPPTRGQDGRPSAVSPLTPPEGINSRDYVGARSPGSPSESTKRKSNFSEGLDDNERR